MKLLVCTVCLAVFCSGCSRFQYFALESDTRTGRSHEFVREDSLVRVEYNFHGENGPVQISVFNKSTQPIFVYWKRSSLIIGEERYPYWQDEATVHLNSVSYRWPTDYWASAYTDGTIRRQEDVSFVPPSSSATILSRHFLQTHLPLLPNTDNNKGVRLLFGRSQSPLEFRSYLTISLDDQGHQAFVIEDNFWVSEVVETNVTPADPAFRSRADFYVRMAGEPGTGLVLWTGLMLLLVVACRNTIDPAMP